MYTVVHRSSPAKRYINIITEQKTCIKSLQEKIIRNVRNILMWTPIISEYAHPPKKIHSVFLGCRLRIWKLIFELLR